jgi:hypothetical protein
MSIIISMDHLLALPLGMYQPYLIHTLSIKVSTKFHQLSKTKLGLSLVSAEKECWGWHRHAMSGGTATPRAVLTWPQFRAATVEVVTAGDSVHCHA